MDQREIEALRSLTNLANLLEYLRDHLDWPLDEIKPETLPVFEYEPEELGLDPSHAVKVESIRQLRPLSDGQPWGIFYVQFEAKRLPVTVLRRILRAFVRRKLESAAPLDHPTWALSDLLFLCSHLDDGDQAFTFVHFDPPPTSGRAARLASFGWTESTPARTVLEYNLPYLRWPEDPGDVDAWRNTWCHAFDKQQLSKAFFSEYQAVFGSLRTDLAAQSDDLDWAHDYALQTLNRCMFLYFVQRKRWLGDDLEFLRSFWDAYKKAGQPKETFYSDWLSVLFFEAFNNRFHGGHQQFPPEIAQALHLAPYLNGGLFLRNELDGQYEHILADAHFAAVLDFFDRFNFTVREDTPLDQEVAVDAEMLGRVYEGLINRSDNPTLKIDQGIVYTPRVEIDLMCRLALVDCLANHIGQARRELLYTAIFSYEPTDKSNADKLISDQNLWPRLDALLRNLTVLDPACGSGAFLVGMLQVLDDLAERANRVLGVQETPYERRKRIVGHSLYGVEVKSWAVEMAELRLWLQLVIETDLAQAELQFRPLLPHLSFNIRRGDSLVQELGGINLARIKGSRQIPAHLKGRLTRLKGEKLKFYNNDKDRQYHTEADLQHEELRLFRDLLAARIQATEARLHEIEAALQPQTDLFGEAGQGQISQGRGKLLQEQASLTAEHEQLTQARKELATVQQVPFVWDIAFVEIFEGEQAGFDIVVGNPPYIRQEKIADPLLPEEQAATRANRSAYKERIRRAAYEQYPTFFGHDATKPTRKIPGTSDYYIFFFLQGLSVLNEKGSFCFITSNAWLDVAYGSLLQEFILHHSHLKLELDNQNERSFENADVNTTITLLAPPHNDGRWGLDKSARFVMFFVPYEEAFAPDLFIEIEQADERVTRDEYRVHPIGQNELLLTGCDATQVQAAQPVALTTAQLAYQGNNWGGKYLRAPDIYWHILEKAGDKLVRLGDVADVRRGITTGANAFFYLDAEAIAEWGIEDEYLRPVIKSPRECSGYVVRPAELHNRILMCHKSRDALKGTAMLEYIRWGEAQGYHQRPSCAGRQRWWDLGERDPFDTVIMRFRDRRNWTPINHDKGMLAGDIVFIGTWHEPHYRLIQNAFANTTFAILDSEVNGRVNLGDGLLTTYGPEIARFWMLEAKKIPDSVCAEMIAAAEHMYRRDVSMLPEELAETDRRKLDEVIFELWGLSEGARDAAYDAVAHLVEMRHQKAASV